MLNSIIATAWRTAVEKSKTELRYTIKVTQQRRPLWAWLNSVFNRVDEERLEEVGPDRACAEWLLRCGARIRWVGKNYYESDYNALPPSDFHHYKIEEIDATGSAVMGIGFPHLKGLKHVRKVILHDCRYLYDDALEYLPLVKDTLESLQLSNCGDITDKGLVSLKQLINLKQLILFQLPEVYSREAAEAMLQQALPSCKVRFTEHHPPPEEHKESK